jgi:hypothetical protein
MEELLIPNDAFQIRILSSELSFAECIGLETFKNIQ